jgi:LPXTG-motif cell wall-anchored protein
MGYRIGSAFVLLGIIALTIFLLGFSIGQEDLSLLLAGAVLSLLGLYLHRRNRKRTRSERFRTISHLFGQREEPDE